MSQEQANGYSVSLSFVKNDLIELFGELTEHDFTVNRPYVLQTVRPISAPTIEALERLDLSQSSIETLAWCNLSTAVSGGRSEIHDSAAGKTIFVTDRIGATLDWQTESQVLDSGKLTDYMALWFRSLVTKTEYRPGFCEGILPLLEDPERPYPLVKRGPERDPLAMFKGVKRPLVAA